MRSEQEWKLQNELVSQGWFFSALSQNSMFKLNSAWSSVQSKLPKNIFNFTIKYINNTLQTRYNLHKWGLSQTSNFSFCFQSEPLLHVIAVCQTYLTQGRFTWQRSSILHFIARTFQSIPNSILYADVPGFVTPSKYLELGKQLREKYKQVKFVNLSISALGFFGKTSSDFTNMMNDLHMDTAQTSFVIRKIINIAIRILYYVFCCRNK